MGLAHNHLFHEAQRLQQITPQLAFFIATDQKTIEEIQRLCATLFSQSYNTHFANNIDIDAYDEHSIHVFIRDLSNQHIIACTRIIPPGAKLKLGKYCTEHEFNLTHYLKGKSDVYELGRTCVDPNYRKTNALVLLWQGMATLLVHQLKAKHLIGCVSINLNASAKKITASEAYIRLKSKQTQVEPTCNNVVRSKSHIMINNHRFDLLHKKSQINKKHVAPLVRKYKQLSAEFSTEGFFDAKFNAVDYFIGVSINKKLLFKLSVVCQLMAIKQFKLNKR